MPREGPAYEISDDWRREVTKAINKLIENKTDDITSFAAFAKKAGIAKSSLSEALADGSTQSTIMPEINKALGWPRPRVLSTPDELEVWAAVEALDERELGKLIGKAEAAVARLRRQKLQRS